MTLGHANGQISTYQVPFEFDWHQTAMKKIRNDPDNSLEDMLTDEVQGVDGFFSKPGWLIDPQDHAEFYS